MKNDKEKLINKKPLINERFFEVDPAGFAPALIGANSIMLLDALRAQIHDFIMNEKSPFRKGLSS